MSSSSNIQDVLAHLAAIVESAQDAIIGENLNRHITSWNSGAETLFGYSNEEAIGKSSDILIPDHYRAEENAAISRVLEGQAVAPCDTVFRCKNGKLIDVSVTISAVRSADGKITGVSKIAHDITERKQVERKLSHLAAIVSSSNDAIISSDLNGVLDSWNEGATRLFGFTAEEAIGQPGKLLFPPEEANEELPLVQMIRTGERVEHFETKRRHKDGSVVNISLTLSPIRDSKGAIIGASGIARSITEEILVKEVERRRGEARSKLEQLTTREQEVLSLVVSGNANKVIARKLTLSEKTVEKYRAQIMKKLGVRSIAELVRVALSAEL